MPCRDYMAEDEERVVLRTRTDQLARHACIFASLLEEFARKRRMTEEELFHMVCNAHTQYGPEAWEWWQKHKKADAKRMAEEAKQDALKKQAEVILNAMSPEDIEALQSVGVDVTRASTVRARRIVRTRVSDGHLKLSVASPRKKQVKQVKKPATARKKLNPPKTFG
jgi:hypothetical protein